LEKAFAAYGIRARPARHREGTSPSELAYDNTNFALLRTQPEEAFRLIWNNAPRLNIDRDLEICVDQVLPSARVGPDGLFVEETAVTYVQSMEGTARELGAVLGRAFNVSVDLPPRRRFEIWGGGTLIFDQFGRVRHLRHKPLADWARQNSRLDYILRAEAESEARAAGDPAVGARGPRLSFHVPRGRGRRPEW
jgi:hypothetical protein